MEDKSETIAILERGYNEIRERSEGGEKEQAYKETRRNEKR